MSGGNKLIDQIKVTLRDNNNNLHTIYIDAFDTNLSRKWLSHLNQLINNDYFLEKNFCFVGFSESLRDGAFIINEINKSIEHINKSSIDYYIDDFYTLDNSIQSGPVGDGLNGGKIIHQHYNMLHRYFEELQGTSGNGGKLSQHYLNASEEDRWHIRQLNLLCHEFESWALSKRKSVYLPEWQRPSQLMCWLNAPRFDLEIEDYEDFGIDTLNRSLGGVYVGVNKAVGKHHWEVFIDEGYEYNRNKDELTTLAMRSQSQAAGDFDIEWANNPGNFKWMQENLKEFKKWLIANQFDPEDKMLTIGHPQCGQVDLNKSFGTTDYKIIWEILNNHLDVYSIQTSDAFNTFDYNWSDDEYVQFAISKAQIKDNILSSSNEYINDVSNKTEEVSDDIMDQVSVLMKLSNKTEEVSTATELKSAIIKIFNEYGI